MLKNLSSVSLIMRCYHIMMPCFTSDWPFNSFCNSNIMVIYQHAALRYQLTSTNCFKPYFQNDTQSEMIVTAHVVIVLRLLMHSTSAVNSNST